MISKQQRSADDDVPAILHRRILEEWLAGKSAKQIARETGLDLATVMRILKRQQKSLVQND
jgi:hypothetical protein